jgi:DNA-binding CsgD family transcriptional regulator/tetratricopeptide (TPR) repeat protein
MSAAQFEHVGAGVGRGSRSTSKRPRLYGRETELAAVKAVVDDARGGSRSAIVVRGAPGIGKSALIAEAVSQADDIRVVQAAGVEAESNLPFAGLHQLLRPLAGLVDALPEPQGGAVRAALALAPGGEADPFLVGAGVLTLLALAAEEQPLLCVVEDAQWLDASSSDALSFAARRLDDEPVGFVFSARDGDLGKLEAPELPQLWLEALGPQAAGGLLQDRFGTLAPGVREQLVAAAGGNPLALLELPLALDADQLAGRAAIDQPLPLTAHMSHVFGARIDALPEPSRVLLVAAAADDTGDPAVVLAAGSALGFDAANLDDVEAEGWCSVDSGRIEFRHPLVRSAVYQRASAACRRAVHAALAEALPGEREADRRAWHLAAAAVGPDETVARELEQSAARAQIRGGYASAAAALRRAAALTPPGTRRAKRQLKAAEEATRAGQRDLAASLLADARLQTSDPLLHAEMEWRRGLIELQEGSPSLAHAIMLAAAGDAESRDSPRAPEMLLDATSAAVYAGDLPGQIEAGRRANQLRERMGPVFELTTAAGLGGLWDDDPARARRLLETAIEQAEEIDNARRFLWAAVCSIHLGDEARARGFAEREVAIARREGAVLTLATTLSRLAFVEIVEGRFPSARANAAEGLALARQIGAPNIACYHHALLAWIAGLLGRENEAEHHAEETFELARNHERAWQSAIARLALGELALAHGRPEDALAQFETLSTVGPQATHPYLGVRVVPSHVVAAVRAGRLEIARPAVDKLAAWVEITGSRSHLALLARCRALIGDFDDAAGEFAKALELHAEIPRPFEQARTELLFGEALRRQGRRGEAREHLRVARTLFSRLGAEPWTVQAERELRASGAATRNREVDGTEELTPQELQVARFVATGATNKEVAAQLFVSPRTIDAHLRSIFRKLGLTSRSQLTLDRLGDSAKA